MTRFKRWGWRLFSIALFGCGFGLSAQAQNTTFQAEGSDAVFGLGARHLAMGGTGTATANDPYALYYNTANLARIDRTVVTIARQLDAELRPTSFIGFATPLNFTKPLGFDATLGFGRYPRVHARSSGAFDPNRFESIFLRYLLPGLPAGFDGDIDSKTLVNRIGLGISPHGFDRLSFGANIDIIDCKTNTCGVNSGEIRSVHAKAISFGVSVSYRATESLTFSAALTDINAELDVLTLVTDASGDVSEFAFTAAFPSRLNLEAAWQVSDTFLIAAGYQKYSGEYGGVDLVISTLHMGAEWRPGDHLIWRAGLWTPLEVRSSNTPTNALPSAIVPTFGIGWDSGKFAADLALIAHPMMSANKGRPVLSAELSVSYRF